MGALEAAERRVLTLPLQLVGVVRPGDVWHFRADLEPFVVLATHLDTGLVTIERVEGGPTLEQWAREQAEQVRRG